MKKALFAAVIAITSFSSAHAATIDLFSSGVTDDGTPVAYGSRDTHFTVTHQGVTIQALVIDNHPAWLDPEVYGPGGTDLGARWLGVSEAVFGDTNGGTYLYETTFDLSNYNASTARIGLDFAVDDFVSVFLNGSLIGSGQGFYGIAGSVLVEGDSGLFLKGLNTLVFNVRNGTVDGFNPSGLFVNVTEASVAPIPLPASFPIFALALGSLGLIAKRRKRLTA